MTRRPGAIICGRREKSESARTMSASSSAAASASASFGSVRASTQRTPRPSPRRPTLLATAPTVRVPARRTGRRHRQHLAARVLRNGPRFAGQHRPVQLQPPGTDDPPIEQRLPASVDSQQIAENKIPLVDDAPALPPHRRTEPSENRQPVHGPLRANLRQNANQRVENSNEPENGVTGITRRQNHDGHGEQNPVEHGKHVAGDDARIRLTGAGHHAV